MFSLSHAILLEIFMFVLCNTYFMFRAQVDLQWQKKDKKYNTFRRECKCLLRREADSYPFS